MLEFSIRKVITNRESQPVDMHEIIPEPLVITENGKIIDMTKDFLREIKRHPILYDPSAEFRHFRGRSEWKNIAGLSLVFNVKNAISTFINSRRSLLTIFNQKATNLLVNANKTVQNV